LRLVRWSPFVGALFSFAVTSALAASVPLPPVAPPSGASRDAVFGIIASDPAGRPFFVRTDSVPNLAGQRYGWFIGMGESTLPVQWVETLTLPGPAASWGGERSSPPASISISPDRREAVARGEAVPEFGVIYHFWTVAPGDPPGRYRMVVKLEDGREERFSFSLPASAR